MSESMGAPPPGESHLQHELVQRALRLSAMPACMICQDGRVLVPTRWEPWVRSNGTVKVLLEAELVSEDEWEGRSHYQEPSDES